MVKIKLLLGCGLLYGSTMAMYAQDKMYLNLRNSTQRVHVLKDVKSLSFLNGQMVVSKADGSSDVQVLSTIKNVLFEAGGTVTALGEENGSALQLGLYPNPLKGDQLKLMLPDVSSAPISITFLKMDGSLAKQYAVLPLYGSKETILDLNGIDPGIYICQVNIGNQISKQKLIKY